MSEIADFLRARYQQEAHVARLIAKTTGCDRWQADWRQLSYNHFDARVITVSGEPVFDGYGSVGTAEFVSGYSPARVLADIEAKLAIVDELALPEEPRGPETDADLHARFAHPAWEYRTTTGPRKQWDGVDDPPCDDEGNPEPGWERNIDAGCPGEGWERFDYMEESYWRRRRSDWLRPTCIPRTLRLLAQPFAGHPDHKGEEWAP
ncbi:DUF6221 family protein [Streptomyces luteogriseus]|uniref:DUF6221 family protein n=1 Tax=Streptomyces luteogriseus TaxID=68233 RepID=UPI003809134C